ncbi:aldehyde oxidase, partial [Salmonella enterica subsp. enterica serovar Typhimurium]|nr:aldehyde oxidase [Salmonella enterica subsp. enterica serovar Typhimurium]
AIKGVNDVVVIPNGVAVLASDYWTAKKGRDALKVEWDEAQAYRGSSDAIVADYRERAKTPGLNARNDGNAEAALAQAGKVIEAEYVFP